MMPYKCKPREEVDHFGAFDFDFDKFVLSNECLGAERSPNMNEVPHLPSAAESFSKVHHSMPSRPHSAFARSDRASPAISGSELLCLEGRPPPEDHMALRMPPSSQSSTSGAPALRRKAKFCGTPLSSAALVSHTGQSQRPQGSTSRPQSNDLHNMFNGSELPASPIEWAQRFEQINLQSARPEFLAPHLQSYPDPALDPIHSHDSQSMSPREQFAHRKTYSDTFNLGLPYNQIVDYDQDLTHPKPGELDDHSPSDLAVTSHGYAGTTQHSQPGVTDGALRQLRQAQSWSQAPTDSFTTDFVSPSQILPEWMHDGTHHDVYYNNTIPYPTPTSQESPSLFPSSEFATHGYPMSGPDDHSGSHGALDYRPQHNHYQHLPLTGNELTGNAEYLLSSIPSHRAPHTPPPSNPSASPPTPVGEESSHPSPTKSINRSVRHKRSTMRLQKMTSNINLNASKSLSNLKAQKSLGNLTLKSRKSTAALGNQNGTHLPSQTGGSVSKSPTKLRKQKSSYLQHQQSSGNLGGGGGGFGFMNYTPNDSAKILTGVAPSGSSKTKARRELEASEERRRLSLAAFKAIQQAGGDVPDGLKGELWDAGGMVET